MLSKEKQRLISDMTAKGSRRVGARIIDFIFEFILLTPIWIWLQITGDDLTILLKVVIVGMIIFAEFIIPILTKGKTVGKLVFNLRIISTSGYNASIKQLFIKSLIYIMFICVNYFTISVFCFTLNIMLSIVYILSIASLFLDIYNRAAWDKLAGVYVVLDKDYKKIEINQ